MQSGRVEARNAPLSALQAVSLVICPVNDIS